jgi:hypothetical protein
MHLRIGEKMADATSFFPSKWLSASDLKGRTVRARTIPGDPIRKEEIGNESKPVLYFVGFKKGLVLNKTNNENLIKFLGAETELWGDNEIELYIVRVPYKGEEVDAIRVRSPETPAETKQSPPQEEIVVTEEKVGGEKKEEPQGSSKIDDVFETFGKSESG